MTTIVYEGKARTLYTDSMVTQRTAGATSRVDATYKVEDLSRLKIVTKYGDRLVAFAFAGSISMFQRMSKFVLSHLHDWHEAHRNLAEQGASIGDFSGSSLMLITSKRIFCFRFGGNRVEVEEVGLGENITFGSGGAFAKAAMEVYGASGFDAIGAAAMCDPHTGCLVHPYRIERNRLIPGQPVLYVDKTVVRMEMRKRAAKSERNLKVANLFDKPPENILVNLDADSSFIKKLREEHRSAQSATSKKKAISPGKTTAETPPVVKTARKKVRS